MYLLFQTVPQSAFKKGRAGAGISNLYEGIETFNRFAGCMVDDLLPEDQDEDDSTMSSVRNIYRRSFLKIEKKKVKQTLEAKTDNSMMKGFETYNKSRIHEDKSSEDFDRKLKNKSFAS